MLTGRTRLDMGKLPRLGNARPRAMRVLREAGFETEGLAKQNASQVGIGTIDPDATGATINSIHTEVNGDTVRVGPSTEYAIYHELGTVKMPARPFLVPAFDEVREQLPERMKGVINV